MIKCEICGEKYHSINATHLVKHNITVAQYIKKYPDAPLRSKEMIEELQNTMKNKWQDKKYRQKQTKSTRKKSMEGNENRKLK